MAPRQTKSSKPCAPFGRNSGVTTPTESTDDRLRVFHGGSWYVSSASLFHLAYRSRSTPAFRYSVLGFRCAQRGARVPLTGG